MQSAALTRTWARVCVPVCQLRRCRLSGTVVDPKLVVKQFKHLTMQVLRVRLVAGPLGWHASNGLGN